MRWSAGSAIKERKRNALETKIAALRAEFDVETAEVHLMAEEEQKRQAVLAENRLEMAHLVGETINSAGVAPEREGGKERK